MTWDEFYSRFCDWAESTCRVRISQLTTIGSGEELVDAILFVQETATKDKLMRKGMQLGVVLTAEDFENLYGELSDELYAQVGAYAHMEHAESFLPVDWPISDEEIRGVSEDVQAITSRKKAPTSKNRGFWAVLAVLGIISTKKKNDRRCDGDCAHCPAHYGYRYGRWYYGHGHQYGCQRGGNGGFL